jgi:hypothetical protein
VETFTFNPYCTDVGRAGARVFGIIGETLVLLSSPAVNFENEYYTLI